ncbi:sugar kinase [Novosphingobium sp. M1R2S20]|uniref:Sugar kinase n=1 Tax=Novosphingobium rhizovicinum TaxID=3228928 RepID=A0ABV3RE58_9SPHN
MARVVCVGEVMVELSADPGGGWQLGFGGDTANTAVHLARSGHDVAYLTAVGRDPFSQQVCTKLKAEGVDTSLILDHPTRNVGLYAISTDEAGERTFSYWRDASAAKALFDLEDVQAVLAQAERADLLSFSLVSLAVLPAAGRRQLLDLARRVRDNGGRVAFDGNYRSRLWETTETAIEARDEAIAVASIGLPTFSDEAELSGAIDAKAVHAHWQRLGCGEVVVKLGSDGCLLPDGQHSPVPARLQPVDTSGAGDAFKGGYLAARLRGSDPAEAAKAGHALAAWTVMRRGAIPARDPSAPYRT